MSKNKILVADDESRMRKLIKDYLVREDYEVVEAENGEQALDIFYMDSDISLIILDVMMPKVDGFAVLEYMRENNLLSKMPVSIISGDSSKETIDRAFTYEIVDMLSKPFNDQNVKMVIEKTLIVKGKE